MPPGRTPFDPLTLERRHADRFEHDVRAAPAGQLPNPSDGVIVGDHEVGGAEVAGELFLFGLPVDGDDLCGAGHGRAHDGAQPHTARADNRDPIACADVAAMQRGADARSHRAADDRCHLERHVGMQRLAADIGNDHVVGPRGHRRVVQDRLAIA